jgi:uncharacterized metal-binding protein
MLQKINKPMLRTKHIKIKLQNIKSKEKNFKCNQKGEIRLLNRNNDIGFDTQLSMPD